ncbi:MAG: flagellar hook-associated protein FlgL [Planctomycetes bacterium]|nr:flagellar hook-associated protein FlgL [Planctomycetota bacterium]
MNIRPTQNANFDLVKAGLNANLAKLITAQEQVSSGKKLLRPSDNPVAAATVLALQRQLGDVSRYSEAIGTARPLLEQGMSALNEASSIMTEARGLAVQGLNGTLNAADRQALAQNLRLLKSRLLEVANTKLGDRFVFGGTETKNIPFSETDVNGQPRVVYHGDGASRSVAVGPGVDLAVNIPGTEAFGRFESSGVSFNGTSGVALGTSANAGTGYGYLTIRHDATSGTPGSAVTLANGGANDTLIGDRTLTIDAAAGTVQLGNGTAVAIPAAGSSGLGDVSVTDENGAVVHLDFTNYDGTDSSATLNGSGSASIDGTNFTALDLSDGNMQLTDSNGTVLHIDARGIVQATTDLYSFDGAVNAFDVIQGMIDDLSNNSAGDNQAMFARLSSRLSEFDRNFDNVQIALGTLGSRSQRMDSGKNQLDSLSINLQGLVSDNQDVDLASVVLDMNKAQQTLEVAQATGAKLLQNTLLNYLG